MMHIITPYGESYKVNERGQIASKNSPSFSGGWLMLGIQHVKRNEFIPFEDLTPERVERLELRFKNGNPQYTVRDLDHGSTREWGNTKVHGIKYIYFDGDPFMPLARENGTTLNSRAWAARQSVGAVYVTGKIWEGALCEMEYPITAGDLAKIGEYTRKNVAQWVKRRAGDFESVTEFRAECPAGIIEWQS